jgi:hypothetical protein
VIDEKVKDLLRFLLAAHVDRDQSTYVALPGGFGVVQTQERRYTLCAPDGTFLTDVQTGDIDDILSLYLAYYLGGIPLRIREGAKLDVPLSRVWLYADDYFKERGLGVRSKPVTWSHNVEILNLVTTGWTVSVSVRLTGEQRYYEDTKDGKKLMRVSASVTGLIPLDWLMNDGGVEG